MKKHISTVWLFIVMAFWIISLLVLINNDNKYYETLGRSDSSLFNKIDGTIKPAMTSNDFAIPDSSGNYSTSSSNLYIDVSADTIYSSSTVIAKQIRQYDVWHAYGYFQDATTTIDLDEDVWGKITNATGNLFIGVEADGITLSNDTLTITNAGDYFGKLTVSLYDIANQDYEMRVYSTSTATAIPGVAKVTTTGTGNYIQFSLPIYFSDVVAGEQFDLQIRNISSNNDPVITDSIFYITYLHE